jgi:hypothetical protein
MHPYNRPMRLCAEFTLVTLLIAAAAGAQPVPKPFPGAGTPPSGSTAAPAAPAPTTAQPPARPTTASPAGPAATAAQPGAPTEVMLGVPIFPSAQFLTSYDAGQGQRYYLFGSTSTFAELVAYYRNVLKQRGELVFEEPATHMFEVGRFREESMAFPPGVTVKDYTWGNLKGYLNPKRGVQPERFPTIIQIVPVAQSER